MHIKPITSTFLFIILLCLSINTNAQDVLNRQITLTKTEGSAKEILQEIELQAEILFSYSNKICLSENIILSESTNTIDHFLSEIFAECPVEYKIRSRKIILLPKPPPEVSNNIRVSGFVKSRKSKEALIGASVYHNNKTLGTSSNSFGYYSFEIPKGETSILSSFIGFRTKNIHINAYKDTTINFFLELNSNLEEVKVIQNMSAEEINTTRSSTITVPIEQITEMPLFMGEVDVIKSLQLLPGINSGSEGLNGFYVRGGGSDQNLFLLDDVPIYNISHLLGFFSIFNADAINSVNITKAGFPARYGGRLSSVLDIRMKDGNKEKIKGTASIGAISSKIALDGPIKSEKTTFNFSARRSYFDLFSSLFQSGSEAKSSFFFYDTNLKLSHEFSPKNKVYASFYAGKDKFFTKYNYNTVRNPNQPPEGTETLNINDESNSGWINQMAALRWNKLYNSKLFSNITVAYSQYSYFIGFEQNEIETNTWNYYEQKYNSGITDLLSKVDFDYFLNNNHHIKFGGNYTYHTFKPGIDIVKRVQNIETVIDSTIGGDNIYGNEFYLYVEDDFHLTPKLKMNVGLHSASYFTSSQAYHSLQPRFSARYLLTPKLAFKTSFSRMTQFMHLVTSGSLALPTDIWIPVTDKIKPQHSNQYTLSSTWQIQNGFDLTVETYYKDNQQLLMINPENSYSSIEEGAIFGDGYAHGIEFLVHKKTDKLTGWFGYTWSKSMNRFSELNKGEYFPTLNDRRHDVGIYSNYKINPRMSISATWAFSSGNAVTLPSQKYYKPQLPSNGTLENGDYSEHIDEIHGYRMPVYHRLDIGVNMTKEIRWGQQTWSMGLYNAYGRQNAFSLYFDSNYDSEGNLVDRQLNQLSIFPFPLPYIRYTIKF
ncbi:TonB-dependent receptor [Saccharicrinis aurantiacus]|uniref:TonB-dependent receptor n=1 Tax=Saccharicrinis aurantiacus TaxID=1849719 RepID=UPI00094F69B3|nr:TonB-dependent receptor [Saccharicrinis aurantiacus]